MNYILPKKNKFKLHQLKLKLSISIHFTNFNFYKVGVGGVNGGGE